MTIKRTPPYNMRLPNGQLKTMFQDLPSDHFLMRHKHKLWGMRRAVELGGMLGITPTCPAFGNLVEPWVESIKRDDCKNYLEDLIEDRTVDALLNMRDRSYPLNYISIERAKAEAIISSCNEAEAWAAGEAYEDVWPVIADWMSTWLHEVHIDRSLDSELTPELAAADSLEF